MLKNIHENIYNKLDYFYSQQKIPHIIFHGSSGSGKRTIVDNFLKKIYQNDHKKIKSNVMFVNCAHGKGIKFIREELKFFAKTNIQSNSGVIFKSIVLLNADNLTIDAQSALRRCIELFSSNTRFFIIVENKHKLLNPILSRFCEIYVPEYIENGKVINLHKLNMKYENQSVFEHDEWIHTKMTKFMNENIDHSQMVDLAVEFYENGMSCLDFIKWIERTEFIDGFIKTEILMKFDKIKSEYRCEKLLLLYLFDSFRQILKNV
uniref:AAA+ ATPase domain-containing protein n=1 Tax=viral metagenome TaxID=1070528 RepID=A0A6C0KHI5_9ZZZZ